MRLIDADMLDDVVQRINENGGSITRTGYKTVDRILFEFPTIDAEPVRHGHWSEEMGGYVCSLCEGFSEFATNYCQHCGAKMNEVTE